MRSLWYVEPGVVDWREVPEPTLQGDGEALVEPVVATRCGLDRLAVMGLTPLEPGYALGHESVARVVEVGPAVTRVAVGDHVVMSPYIACGTCRPCSQGRNAFCATTPPVAAYGVKLGEHDWGGLCDDLVRVPYADAMLTPVPAVIGTAGLVDLAAAGDSVALGQEVMAQRVRDEGRSRVLVIGETEHGLYQTAFAFHYGAGEVVLLDADPDHRKEAEALGARTTETLPDPADGTFDLVVTAHHDDDLTSAAFHLLADEGAIDSLGGFGEVRVPHLRAYELGASFRVYRGRSGPDDIAATVRAVTEGVVRPAIGYSAVVDWEDLPAAYGDPFGKPVAVRPGLA